MAVESLNLPNLKCDEPHLWEKLAMYARPSMREHISLTTFQSLESVLTQINALNRSIEGIIEIGNEFASVEALWSQFETVMGKTEEVGANGDADGAAQQDGGKEDHATT
jgi:hypothetical protein